MKTRLLFFICFISIFSAHARVLDHLKPAKNKLEIHKMKNIDFIYIINLDQRPEKYLMCLEQLYPYGIYPYRFSAVNGWELSLKDINDVGVRFNSTMEKDILATSYLTKDLEPHHGVTGRYGRTYFCHCMSRGAIGIVLSHLSVLKDAYDSGYETIWIMEDDIEVLKDPRIISDVIENLDKTVGKKGWDILFTDRDTKGGNGDYVSCSQAAKRPNFRPRNPEKFSVNKPLKNGLRRIGARYGAYSMIVRRSGMEKLISFYNKYQMFLPYDMENPLPEGMRLFTVTEDVVSFRVGSDSDNGGPNYLTP